MLTSCYERYICLPNAYGSQGRVTHGLRKWIR